MRTKIDHPQPAERAIAGHKAATSPNVRRRKASNAFALRVALLLFLMAGIAYAAWFSPWAKPIHSIKMESGAPSVAAN